MCRPFRALVLLDFVHPGRCPGLTCFGLSGREHRGEQNWLNPDFESIPCIEHPSASPGCFPGNAGATGASAHRLIDPLANTGQLALFREKLLPFGFCHRVGRIHPDLCSLGTSGRKLFAFPVLFVLNFRAPINPPAPLLINSSPPRPNQS